MGVRAGLGGRVSSSQSDQMDQKVFYVCSVHTAGER